MENEILREAVEVMKSREWLARSNVAAKRARPADWRNGRQARKTDDAGLVAEIRQTIADFQQHCGCVLHFRFSLSRLHPHSESSQC